MIKNITFFLLSIGCIFCVEIKSMDGWNPFCTLNFRDLVLSILGGVRFAEIDIPTLENDYIKPAVIIEPNKDSSDEFIMHNNNNGTSTIRFVFDENTLEEIDVRGSGDLFLYQEKDRAQGWVEITTLTEDIHRFKIDYGFNNEKIIVSPKKSADVTRYSCCVYAKQRIPVLSFHNNVIARLATNITSESLMFKLQEHACLLATDKRIKIQLLCVWAWNNAKVMKLQGVATCQELFLCDQTQYTSELKSNRVHIDAHERSKACIYLENNLRNPSTIKGKLDDISELRYSGNPLVRDLLRNSSSLLQYIDK